MRRVGRNAGECGVDYCLEVLNRFEGYLLNTCAECRKFVEEVDVDAVKIMLDTFHMNILTGKASGFSDVRCYWSPEAVERVSGWKPEGKSEKGFIHLINSGSTCLDATGKAKDEKGRGVMKPWWGMQEEDIEACLKATDWCPAELC